MFMIEVVEIRNWSISENAMLMHIHMCHGQNLGEMAISRDGHPFSFNVKPPRWLSWFITLITMVYDAYNQT